MASEGGCTGNFHKHTAKSLLWKYIVAATAYIIPIISYYLQPNSINLTIKLSQIHV